MYTLDLETKSLDPANPQFALEPFRYSQGRAIITDISVTNPDMSYSLYKDITKDQIIDILRPLSGEIMYMHNATFDTAWLYVYIKDVIPLCMIDIRDTLLLAKWILNSQAEQYKTKDERDEEGGYDLISLVVRFLDPNTPGLQDYIKIKSTKVQAGVDPKYWSLRASLDSHFTLLLAEHLQTLLPDIQRRGFLISQKQIPYVARAWVEGTPFNEAEVNRLLPLAAAAKRKIANKLGINEDVLQSPPQLSNLLFNQWGLTPLSVGKKGAGSTAAGDLKMLALTAQGTPMGERMKMLMDFKKLQTLQTKYLNGFTRVKDYIGEAVCHGSPRIFGTYTGRYTYASKILKQMAFQISIAMHQLPREGPSKSLIVAPDGYSVGKYDASGQEIAFMAFASLDPNMLSVLRQGMNVHSWMATNLTGEDYVTFITRLKNDPTATNIRQAAKLLNLSCQYRIGWKALQSKFFETYDIIISQLQSNQYLRVYKTSYPGVPRYWKSTCLEARKNGFAETIARRRYYLTDWDEYLWATESSAINTPVQGSGADQKDLVIWQVSENFPEVRFALDIHDEGIFYLPNEHAEELNKDIVHFLNSIDYDMFWDREVPMPLQFEGQLGKNFKHCQKYEQPWNEYIAGRRAKGLNTFGN